MDIFSYLKQNLEKGLYVEGLYEMAERSLDAAKRSEEPLALYVLSKIFWGIAYDWDERPIRTEEVKEMEQRILKDLKETVNSLIENCNLAQVSNNLNRLLLSFLK